MLAAMHFSSLDNLPSPLVYPSRLDHLNGLDKPHMLVLEIFSWGPTSSFMRTIHLFVPRFSSPLPSLSTTSPPNSPYHPTKHHPPRPKQNKQDLIASRTEHENHKLKEQLFGELLDKPPSLFPSHLHYRTQLSGQQSRCIVGFDEEQFGGVIALDEEDLRGEEALAEEE